MTDNTELKRLAEAAMHPQGCVTIHEELECLYRFRHACNPAEILTLIADNERLNAENKQLILLECHGGTAQAAINLLAERDQFKAEIEALRKDSGRYQWLRDKSEAVHQFYLSVPLWFTGVRFRAQDVDKAIDAMSKGEQL